jgi:SAM-dependent methyltransferase
VGTGEASLSQARGFEEREKTGSHVFGREGEMRERVDWRRQAREGFLASGIDVADRRGHKNFYIDLLHKMALEEALRLNGDERVLDFGCGGGRISSWIASRVKTVIGLDETPEMIELAERNCKAENVKFVGYDGTHFPDFPGPFDLILSVWVLQYMESDRLKEAVSGLAHFLREGGRFCLIEQVSDHPERKRPGVNDYLQTFKESKLKCLRYYPIRKGRWWLLYLIRYGIISERWFPQIAHHELKRRRKEKESIRQYKDFLFLVEKETGCLSL